MAKRDDLENLLEFHPYEDVRGEFRWRLVASNGRIMADSSEGYTRAEDRDDALQHIIDSIQTSEFYIGPRTP